MAEHAFDPDKNWATVGEGRFEAIAPLVQLLEVPISRRFPHLLPDGTRASTLTHAIDWCAKRGQCSRRTIQRRIAKFKNAGEAALEFPARRDKGRSRFFTQHSKAAAFAAYTHLALNLSFSAVHQAIARNSEALDVRESKLPCCETVRLWLRSAPPTLVELALEGQRAYRELMFSDLERGLLVACKDRSK